MSVSLLLPAHAYPHRGMYIHVTFTTPSSPCLPAQRYVYTCHFHYSFQPMLTRTEVCIYMSVSLLLPAHAYPHRGMYINVSFTTPSSPCLPAQRYVYTCQFHYSFQPMLTHTEVCIYMSVSLLLPAHAYPHRGMYINVSFTTPSSPCLPAQRYVYTCQFHYSFQPMLTHTEVCIYMSVSLLLPAHAYPHRGMYIHVSFTTPDSIRYWFLAHLKPPGTNCLHSTKASVYVLEIDTTWHDMT